MIKHLNFEEEKAKCLAKSKKVIYDKSYFIGSHTEDGVEAYGCAENGFVFIHKAYAGFESED